MIYIVSEYASQGEIFGKLLLVKSGASFNKNKTPTLASRLHSQVWTHVGVGGAL